MLLCPHPFACTVNILTLVRDEWILALGKLIFSTSESFQMCYCCRKLEFSEIFERLWGAVRGRGRPCSLIGQHRSVRESEPIREHGLPRTPTASHGLSNISINSDSLAHGLSTFLMWSVWANQMCHKSLISCWLTCPDGKVEILEEYSSMW